jgi:hypothetical protein
VIGMKNAIPDNRDGVFAFSMLRPACPVLMTAVIFAAFGALLPYPGLRKSFALCHTRPLSGQIPNRQTIRLLPFQSCFPP